MPKQSPANERSSVAIGQRLVLTRAALQMSQGKFGLAAGIKANTLSQLENGKFRISIDNAIALAETYKLTLDWIYLGDPSGLPYRLWDAIKALRDVEQEREQSLATRGRRAPR